MCTRQRFFNPNMQRQLPLRYIVGSLFHRRGSSILTLFSFFLVTLIWIALQSMMSTIHQTLQHSSLADRGILMAKQASAENQSRLSNQVIHSFEGFPEISMNPDGRSRVLPTRVATTYAEHGDRRSQLNVRGVQFDKITPIFPEFMLLTGTLPDRYSNQSLLGSGLAKTLSFSVGDTLTAWHRKWIISGIFNDGGSPFQSELWVDDQTLYSIIGKQEPSSAWFRVKQPQVWPEVKLRTDQVLHGIATLYTEQEFFSKKSFATEELRLLVGFVSLILSTGAVLSALNTLYASLSSREAELATFRAIGFRKSAVVVSVLTEALLMALLGGILASITALALNGIQFRTLISGIGYLSFSLQIKSEHLFSGLVFALLMGCFGGIFPARHSVRKSVIDSLQRAHSLAWLIGLGVSSLLIWSFSTSESVASKATVEKSIALKSFSSQTTDSLITLKQMKEHLRSSHPSLQSYPFQETQVGLTTQIEGLNRWPSLQFFSQFYLLNEPMQYPRADINGNLELVSQGKPNDFILRAEARQSLQRILQYGYSKEKYDRQRDQIQVEEELAWRELEIELESLYERNVYLIQSDQIVDKLITELQRLFTMQKKSNDAGFEPDLKLFPIELRVDEAKNEQKKIQNERKRVRDVLWQLYDPKYGGFLTFNGEPQDIAAPQFSTQLPQEVTADQICSLLCEKSIEEWSITQHPYLNLFDLSIASLRAEEQRTEIDLYPTISVAGRVDYSGPPEIFGVDLPGLHPVQARIGVEIRFQVQESRTAHLHRQRVEAEIREIEMRKMEWIDQTDQKVRDTLLRLKTACQHRNHTRLSLEQVQQVTDMRAEEYANGQISSLQMIEDRIKELEAQYLNFQSEWELHEIKFGLARILALPPSAWSTE